MTVPDGMGGTLLFSEDVIYIPPPPTVRLYRANPSFTVNRTSLQQWLNRLGLGTGWLGREGEHAWAAVTEAGHFLRVDGNGLTYLRLWGARPPQPPPDLATTIVRSLMRAVPPGEQGIALQQTAFSPALLRYAAYPLLHGLPVLATEPWAEAEVTATGILRYARFTPLELSLVEEQNARPFETVISGLNEERILPRAVLQRPFQENHTLLAERTFPVRWERGATIRLFGRLLVLQAGEENTSVRAWLVSPTGTFVLQPPPPDVIAWAKKGTVMITGRLKEGDQVARWGIIEVTHVGTPPPYMTYRGTLRVGTVVRVEAPEGSFLLPDAPQTLPDGISVLVEGYGRGVGFQWTRLYTAPPTSTKPRGTDFTRQVIRVEPVYWLEWRPANTPEAPLEGYLYPAWRVVTTDVTSEIDFIYSMFE